MVVCKKSFLKNVAKLTLKHLYQGLFINKAIKRDSPTQVFSSEFCKIFKNTFF